MHLVLFSLLFATISATTSLTFTGNFQMSLPNAGAGYYTGTISYNWTANKMMLVYGSPSYTETYDWNPTWGYSSADTSPQFLFTVGPSTYCNPTCKVVSLSEGMPPLATSLVGTYLTAGSGSTCLPYTPSKSGSYMKIMYASSTQVCNFTLSDGREFVMTSYSTGSAVSITIPTGCQCTNAIDIEILVDHSLSITNTMMGQFKTFCQNYLNTLTISATQVNVGMSFFSYYANGYVGKNWGITSSQATVDSGMAGWVVPQCVSGSKQCQYPATSTASGVNFAISELFVSSRKVPKILMTLTDGAMNMGLTGVTCCSSSGSKVYEGCSADLNTAMTAAKATAASKCPTCSMTFIAVGIGPVCTSTDNSSVPCNPSCKYPGHLLRLADGISSNVLSVDSFSSLSTIVGNLQALSCTTTTETAQATCQSQCTGVCICGSCIPPTGCQDNICETYTLTSNGCTAVAKPIATSCPVTNKCLLATCNRSMYGGSGGCTTAPVDCSSVKDGCNNCIKYTCDSTTGKCTVPDTSGCPAAVDCVYSDWTAWTTCSSSCGSGTATSSRTIVSQPKNCGAACDSTTLSRSQNCNAGTCAVDCQWGPWGSWNGCSATCGGGTQTATRSATQAVNGGVACVSSDGTTSQNCGSTPCPVPCLWWPWGSWTPCSTTCGTGSTTGSRTVQQNAANGGADCTGGTTTTVSCNLGACPVDCVWNSWGAFQTCSLTCGGGTQTRSRTINTTAANGGAACGTNFTDTAACNSQICPVPCSWAPWQDWGSCSVSCGGGSQTAIRSISQEALGGATACVPTDGSKTQSCNPTGCPVNCVWSPWGSWGSCSLTCGGGTQMATRTITTQSANGGAACGTTNTVNQTCNSNLCPVNCVWSTWSAYGACTVTCGGGIKYSTRNVTTQAANGGLACGNNDTQTTSCSTNGCPVPCVGDWSQWTGCDCHNHDRNRTYTITTVAANGGANCSDTAGTVNETCVGQTWDVTDCNPVPCAGHWSNWTTCDCTSFTQTRTYHVDTPASNGGSTASCAGTDGEVETPTSCTPTGCPVNCTGDWGDWTGCSCQTNSQNRTYHVTTAVQNNGVDCDYTDLTLQDQPCTPSNCPTPCEGTWSDWTPCDCTTSKSTRTFTVTKAETNNGAGCGHTDQEVAEVSCTPTGCPVNCTGNWGSWTTCDCATNFRSHNFTLITAAQNGGVGCVAVDQQVGHEACTPVNCPTPCIGEWNSWNGCSCQTSQQNRTFHIITAATNNGSDCIQTDNYMETLSCTPTGCPVPCDGAWTEWGNCDCTSQSRIRTYTIYVAAQNGGANCVEGGSVVTNGQVDTETGCTKPENCPTPCVGHWSEWNNCTCDAQSQTRTYVIDTAATNGGASCPGDQTQTCTPTGCPVNCEGSWSTWSTCVCGETNPTQTRTYTVTQEAENGGDECDEGDPAQQTCTPQNCPTPCEGEWSDWTPCNCSVSQSTRTFTVTEEATNGGDFCNAGDGSQETLTCNHESCPNYGPTCETDTDCDDSQPCTVNKCVSRDDGLKHCDWSETVVCNDNSICTSDRCDLVQGCVYETALNCNDNDACTEDTCDPVTGCHNTRIDCPNSTDKCYLPICDKTTGCSLAQRYCPHTAQDNCTVSVCRNSSSTSTGCVNEQLCGFNFAALGLAIGGIVGVCVAAGLVGMAMVSGGAYAIAHSNTAAADIVIAHNPLYTPDGACGVSPVFEAQAGL